MHGEVLVRLYAELNELVRRPDPQGRYRVPVGGYRAAKDAVESLGVPHTEVDLLLLNGDSVPFTAAVGAGDQLTAFPVFEAFDVGSLQQVRPEPLRDTRFVLDVHLGTLARNLRLLGFDTVYGDDGDDRELARTSARQRRILLTRDRGLLKRAQVTHGYLVRTDDPLEQTVDVVRRFDLGDRLRPFTRCLTCNGELEAATKQAVLASLPPRTRRDHTRFVRCRGCDRVYWPGSHHDHLRRVVADIGRRVAKRRLKAEPATEPSSGVR